MHVVVVQGIELAVGESKINYSNSSGLALVIGIILVAVVAELGKSSSNLNSFGQASGNY
jgi:hypothetical protein